MTTRAVMPEERMCGAAITLVVAALAGCTPLPEVVGLECDPSFTYAALSAAPLAVFGVTSESLEPASASASLQLGGLLAQRLATKRRDLSVLAASQVADSLGIEDYTSFVREYQARGSLDEGALSRLAASLGGVRYMVLARLEVDELLTASSVDKYSEERGGVDCNVEETTNVAARTLAVHFTVYDLHLRRSAWAGQITDLKERTNSDAWNSCDTLLFNVLTMLLNGESDLPELTDVLGKVFEDFARHLPRA